MAERPENPVGALESRLAEEAGYSEDSAAKPIARKKKNTRKRRRALTPDNVLNELKEVNWETLCDTSSNMVGGTLPGVLELPGSEGQRIEKMYVSEEELKSAGVLWWVDHHPLASWRLLITQLEGKGKHSLANRIHQYAEKVTDHSFTHQNISIVTTTLDDDELDRILQVPISIQDEIRKKISISADFREGAIEYYIQYSPRATWDELAGELYYEEYREALAAARRFIKRTPETTLNLPNLNTLLESVSHVWYAIGMWMKIPLSKLDEIRSQYSGDAQRCSRACWEVYLEDHPSPTWQLVAYALYQGDHLEELEVVLKKYLKGSAENLRQFEEAIKYGQHCIRCIHSHRPPTGSESECPQIIVIGTHVDHEKKSSESREQKNRKILKHLSPIDRKQIMFHDASEKKVFFPVNARFPGDAEDKIVKQVRQGLFCTDLVTPVDIPSRWFALEILLGEMAQALERGVLSKEDCITAAIEKLHFEEDAVDAALQYLDQVSAIMYYPKILPNVIFADPQIVLDKISELVFKSVKMEKLSKEQALTGDWIQFHDFALITIKFLLKEDFNTHYVPGLFEVGDLVFLFKKLLVFATFSKSEYFVPALLHHLDSKAVDDHRVRCIPSLVLLFPGGGPRQGIFCALLCWLVSPENDSPAPWSISVDDLGSPLCLYRNCVQFDVPKLIATVTLIDTYTHFEVHINIQPEDTDVCPEEFPVIRKVIEKGLHKASLNLGYFNSSPSPALLCPCGRGEAHAAEITSTSTRWKCLLKGVPVKQAKLTQLQHLLLDNSGSCHDKKSTLSESDHLSRLLCQLNPRASKWREIGTHLGFHQGELDNIEHKPLLLNEGPKAWLREMLREWLEWAPGDSRGSSSSASIECLKCALDKSGLAQTALKVESCFTQTVASEHAPPTKRPKLDLLASKPVT